MALMAEVRPVADPLSVSYRATSGAVERTLETQRQAGFVQDGFAKIPANGEGVAEAKERLKDANASLSAAMAYFQPLNE